MESYSPNTNSPQGKPATDYIIHMKVIPQYKVIGPYNYDKIIHNIEKNNAKRQDTGYTNGKIQSFILKIKICVTH